MGIEHHRERLQTAVCNRASQCGWRQALAACARFQLSGSSQFVPHRLVHTLNGTQDGPRP
jgi:hypothetical protein